MRRYRFITLVAATFALSIAPVAAADGGHGAGRPVVVPAGSEISGLWFHALYELPAADNPFAGKGDPCVRFGRRGKVLSAIAATGTVTCTAERGTVLNTGWDHWCSNFDPPDSEFYAVSAAEQRRCALAVNRPVTKLTLTVDGKTTNILRRRFARFSPQVSLNLPAGNIFDLDPALGPYTLTSYGWDVLVTNLQVGRHVITIYAEDGDFSGSFEHIINIVPRAHGMDAEADHQ